LLSASVMDGKGPFTSVRVDGRLWENPLMNRTVTSLLAAIGLAPASRVDQLNGDVRRVEGKVAQLERQLEEARADAQSWKKRHEDTTEAVAGWKQATHRAQAETEYAKKNVDRIRGELERAKAELEREQPRMAEERRRAETLKAELQDMRARAEHAHRVTDSANEQLMAMEVKLDLIEAAIQILDARTREQAVPSAL
jgi:chromosome segregation ATPase